MMKKPVLIAVLGPTASGKTGVAIKIANHFSSEIISCDSRQFFRELKIGAAPPTPEELAQEKHHLVGHLSISQQYSAGGFENEALELIKTLHKTHKALVMVGGSGLYARAVFQGMDTLPKGAPHIRESLKSSLENEGIEVLQNQLEKLDPEYFAEVDLQNPQRLIRALEVCLTTGKKFSELRKNSAAERPFDVIKIGLQPPREELYHRINTRVDEMLADGLLEEARSLYPHRQHNALQTVGYKEIFDHLDGNISLEETVEKIKQHTRNYAKRQITWFKKEPGLQWFLPSEVPAMIAFIQEKMQ